MNNLGTNVKFYRNKMNMTQVTLAGEVELTSNYIALIETGKKLPSLKTLQNIAQVLHVDTKDLINEDPVFDELAKLANKYGLEKISKNLEKILL